MVYEQRMRRFEQNFLVSLLIPSKNVRTWQLLKKWRCSWKVEMRRPTSSTTSFTFKFIDDQEHLEGSRTTVTKDIFGVLQSARFSSLLLETSFPQALSNTTLSMLRSRQQDGWQGNSHGLRTTP